jgi:hypothetical protein
MNFCKIITLIVYGTCKFLLLLLLSATCLNSEYHVFNILNFLRSDCLHQFALYLCFSKTNLFDF